MSRTPYDDPEWDEFVRNVREGTLKQIESSAFVMSLVPSADDVDIKFAVELGLSIMLDKPLLVIGHAGRAIPDRLRRVADELVEADIDTEHGQRLVRAALDRLNARTP